MDPGLDVGPVNRSGGTVSDLPEVMASAVYRRPGQVLVAVDHCGICGSDIHLLLD